MCNILHQHGVHNVQCEHTFCRFTHQKQGQCIGGGRQFVWGGGGALYIHGHEILTQPHSKLYKHGPGRGGARAPGAPGAPLLPPPMQC